MPLAGSNAQRATLIAIIVMVSGLLGYAYYTQYVEYLDPCPLCLTQRFFYFLCGIFALLALFRAGSVRWQKTLSTFIFISSTAGIGTASRQVWLQHLPPDKVPECGPGLQYWIENMPFLRTLELLFKGDGNCAEVDWTFLGLSMASWSLLMFVLVAVVSIWLFFCRSRLSLMLTD
ncbi:MAG: disulfide bond formation protein B [Granulosicoccaceae bacterium]